ncbi:MAG: site-specific DNA-methyltransferase [Selenomonadaceae bacterium]|nr:site-specific DNA-methyltransferase [Selenomonadaceae bacterium]
MEEKILSLNFGKFEKNIHYTISEIKKLGLIRSDENIKYLLDIYDDVTDIELKREVVSSIGRQKDNKKILDFIKNNVYKCGFMDLVYQMYRTCLYKGKTDEEFKILGDEIKKFFNNEVLNKMSDYFNYKQSHVGKKDRVVKYLKPILLQGNNIETLSKIEENSVQLIFTSPPYYNAKIYSNYHSYQDYLEDMFHTLKACHRVLEEGRFIIINVSPVISKRPGREFESIRYPIHFDFHNLLTKAGFYFIDEIQWIKPESSVKNRNGGYQQTHMPLSYKPNCINESIMVYRKYAPFLLDKNIAMYDKTFANDGIFESSNCWYIAPASNKSHPAVFPKELCRRILKYYSFRGDVVLDPFAGSGTFGEVAIEMKRTPILCEKNELYCKLINEGNYYVQL